MMITFAEAMQALQDGKRVSREEWEHGVYFKKHDDHVFAFAPRIQNYQYNEDILISNNWEITGEEGKLYSFAEIIPFLKDKKKARLSHWTRQYIFLDITTNNLLCYLEENMAFVPDFLSFVAKDWIVIE